MPASANPIGTSGSVPPIVGAGICEEGVAALVKVLSTFPRGLKQAALREVLVGLSQAFDKNAGGPSISALVSLAHRRGLVEVAPVGHVNPHITLVAQVPAVAQ